jgi:hypothetical protein
MTTNHHTPHSDGDLLDADVLNSPLSELDSAISDRTGADDDLVSGTAGDDGDLAVWNADGDAVEGDPAGSDVKGDFDDLTERLEAAEATFMNYEDTHGGHCVYLPPTTLNSYGYDGCVIQKFSGSQMAATPWDDNPNVGDGAPVGTFRVDSKPGVSPWREITYLEARKAACNAGPGWFLTPARVWARLAFEAAELGTQPRGPNGDTNPPSDAEYPDELGIRDWALADRGAHDSALTGSGPVTWSHNWRGDGVADLNGNIWEWVSGLFLLPENLDDDSTTPHEITGAGEDGYVLIHANDDLSLRGSPFGESTGTAAGSLTDSNKDWITDEFAGNFLYDAGGNLYYIDSNTANVLSVDGADTPASGPYEILELVETDVTAGMSSGNRILTLRSDANLGPLAIPATSDGTGSTSYGQDGYWFNPTALRAAIRGGGWFGGVRAGVFALVLGSAPSDRFVSRGFRACKSL